MSALHRYVMLGPQGSGKGTQGERLASRLAIPHVSTGELFREAITGGTALGRAIDQAMQLGELIPDTVVNNLVRDEFSRRGLAAGYVLDGYPRTVSQAEELERLAAPSAVVLLEISDEVAVERLAQRLVCSGCGATYHPVSLPPAEPNRCDRCGGTLTTRSDDREEAVRMRLHLYHEATEPLIAFYREQQRLVRVDASQSIDDVGRSLERALGL